MEAKTKINYIDTEGKVSATESSDAAFVKREGNIFVAELPEKATKAMTDQVAALYKEWSERRINNMAKPNNGEHLVYTLESRTWSAQAPAGCKMLPEDNKKMIDDKENGLVQFLVNASSSTGTKAAGDADGGDDSGAGDTGDTGNGADASTKADGTSTTGNTGTKSGTADDTGAGASTKADGDGTSSTKKDTDDDDEFWKMNEASLAVAHSYYERRYKELLGESA